MLYEQRAIFIFDQVLAPTILEAFDQVFLPAVSQMLLQQEHRLKDYIDRKFTDHTAEMIKRFDAMQKTEKQFRERVIAIFKRNHLASPEDIAFLEGLAQ